MILRSQLKEGQYVRIQTELDNDFWYKPLAGRYFQVDVVAKEPDDAKAYRPCYGTVICWGMNYSQQLSNHNMIAITNAEQERIEYIFKHKEEFKDLFRLGRKIDRIQEQIDDIIADDFGEYGIDVWEYESAEVLAETLEDCVEPEEEDLPESIEDIRELFDNFLLLLQQLTELEDRYVRQVTVL